MRSHYVGITIGAVLAIYINGNCQGNLVPNNSFEIHQVNGNSSVYNASPWKGLGTADLHNPTNAPIFGVPLNGAGYQYAYTDSSYAGIEIYFSAVPNRREYIQVQLVQPMDSGTEYCVSFYVSPAGGLKYSSDRIGAVFSIDSNSTCSMCLLPIIPQVQNLPGDVIVDTTNWTLIYGTFTADSSYSYITIGNFYSDSATSNVIINPAGQNGWGSYFFIDEVNVVKKLNAFSGTDAEICSIDSVQLGAMPETGVVYYWFPTVGLSDSTSANPWAKPLVTTTYYLTISDTGNLFCTGNLVDSVTITVRDCTPIPPLNIPTLLKGEELFFITSLPANSSLKIYDIRGRLILREENYQNDFSAINLDASVYLYELTLPDLTVQKGKFCVVK